MTTEAKETLVTSEIKKQLLALLKGGQAHVDLRKALADLPPQLRGRRPEKVPYSAWQLMEHLRITQRDILEFSTDRGGKGYKRLRWPEEYWPTESDPPAVSAWDESLTAIHADREEFEALLTSQEADLVTPFAWGDGQTLLREALLIADHTAYHLGEVVLLRRLLGAWES